MRGRGDDGRRWASGDVGIVVVTVRREKRKGGETEEGNKKEWNCTGFSTAFL